MTDDNSVNKGSRLDSTSILRKGARNSRVRHYEFESYPRVAREVTLQSGPYEFILVWGN